KERIVEYLAVQSRANKLTGPILCLVGPPGVGKTSLGKSIAKATGREFVRVSLGGVRDEAEIRGHRRTYIGSMPGKIIQSMRKAGKERMLNKKSKVVKVTDANLAEYLGVPKFRYGEIEDADQIGVVTGLAWTDVGGELLTIEAAMMPGKGRMTVTGNLRDVMKESISAAASYVRMRAVAFGIKPPLFDKRDIHVHVPEGATPKDGPSAG